MSMRNSSLHMLAACTCTASTSVIRVCKYFCVHLWQSSALDRTINQSISKYTLLSDYELLQSCHCFAEFVAYQALNQPSQCGLDAAFL